MNLAPPEVQIVIRVTRVQGEFGRSQREIMLDHLGRKPGYSGFPIHRAASLLQNRPGFLGQKLEPGLFQQAQRVVVNCLFLVSRKNVDRRIGMLEPTQRADALRYLPGLSAGAA